MKQHHGTHVLPCFKAGNMRRTIGPAVCPIALDVSCPCVVFIVYKIGLKSVSEHSYGMPWPSPSFGKSNMIYQG